MLHKHSEKCWYQREQYHPWYSYKALLMPSIIILDNTFTSCLWEMLDEQHFFFNNNTTPNFSFF